MQEENRKNEQIQLMKDIASGSIVSKVFDILCESDFEEFIENTYVPGGSTVLKGKKVTAGDVKASLTLIEKLHFRTDQEFLHIIGMSGSGKSEIMKQLRSEGDPIDDIKYLPLDQSLKMFLNEDFVKNFPLFMLKDQNTRRPTEFDSMKFEYAMYCAVFACGKYSGYIIEHSGGSALQPGLQALTKCLAGSKNYAVHLKVNSPTIMYNLAHSVMYGSFQSVEKPLIDEIWFKLGLVPREYQRLDPSKSLLVEFERAEGDLHSFRDTYKEFWDRSGHFAPATDSFGEFRSKLSRDETGGRFNEQSYTYTELLNIHLEAAQEYVDSNEWRKEQFEQFKGTVRTTETFEAAKQLVKNYLDKQKRFRQLSEKLQQLSEERGIRIANYLSEVDDEFDVYLFDMHGVLHSGGEIPEETLKYLAYLREERHKIVIIASNDVRIGDDYEKVLRGKQLIKGVHFDCAVTSGDVFKSMIDNGKIGKEIPHEDERPIKVFILDFYDRSLLPEDKFEIVDDINAAEAVLTGSPRMVKDGKSIRIPVDEYDEVYVRDRSTVLDAIDSRNLPIIVPNPDPETPFENLDFCQGFQTVGSGALADYCEEHKYKVKIIRTGKPSEVYYDHIKSCIGELLGGKKETSVRIAMIGDSFATDIIGGNWAEFTTIAVANDASNIGLMLSKDEDKFVKMLEDKRSKPNIFVYGISK